MLDFRLRSKEAGANSLNVIARSPCDEAIHVAA